MDKELSGELSCLCDRSCYAYLCPLCNFTIWNIIMILYSYVEQVMTMCCIQDWQLSLSYFLSYFNLMVLDAISRLLHNLNTLWYIIMILYSYVEQVLTMSRVQEWQLSLSYFLSYFPLIVSDAILCPLHNFKPPPPPPPPKKKKKNVFLILDSLSKFTY